MVFAMIFEIILFVDMCTSDDAWSLGELDSPHPEGDENWDDDDESESSGEAYVIFHQRFSIMIRSSLFFNTSRVVVFNCKQILKGIVNPEPT